MSKKHTTSKINNKEKNATSRTLMVLFLGVLMGALDISIVGPAIPSIRQTISMDEKALVLVFSIYVLFSLLGISFMAKLSDRYGRRLIYVISLAVFGLGSLIVAMSGTYAMLLTGRAIQGYGSSGIFPIASAVIGDVFPPKKRGRALGIIGSVFGIAFIIGPLIAGVILKYLTWNYLFIINLPIVIFVILFSIKVLSGKESRVALKVDVKGTIFLSLFIVFFASAMYVTTPEDILKNIHSESFVTLATLSVIFFFLLIRSEKRALDPILKLSLFKNPQILLALLLTAGTGIFEASFVFIPNLAVTAFSVNASQASFMLIPCVIAAAIGAPLWGRMVDKFGSKLVVVGGFIFSSAGLLLLSKIGENLPVFYVAGILCGFGLSALVGSSLRYIALNEASASDRASSQGMITIFINAGQILGSVLIGVIASKQGDLEGFRRAFRAYSVFTVFLALVSLMLKSRKKEFNS